MRYFLLNDTSTYHCGSARVVYTIHNTLREWGWEHAGFSQSTELARNNIPFSNLKNLGVDVLIINGEGTLWGQPHKRAPKQIMSLARNCIDTGIKVALINTQWEMWLIDKDNFYTETLTKIHFVHTREKYSQRRLQKLGVESVLAPDWSIYFPIHNNVNFFDGWVVGKSYRFPIAQGSIEIKAADWYTSEAPYLPIEKNTFWEDIVSKLKGSLGYITGQHHGICAAFMAGIPVIALPTMNSKINALQEYFGSFGYVFPIAENAKALAECVKNVNSWWQKCPDAYKKSLEDADKMKTAMRECLEKSC